jgi:hypothetical protein
VGEVAARHEGVRKRSELKRETQLTKQLTRIAPWQAGKLFAFIYFVLSTFMTIPLALLSSTVPSSAPGPHFSAGVFVALPFLYAICGLIFVPLGCWIYNLAAKFVGGLEISVSDKVDPSRLH